MVSRFHVPFLRFYCIYIVGNKYFTHLYGSILKCSCWEKPEWQELRTFNTQQGWRTKYEYVGYEDYGIIFKNSLFYNLSRRKPISKREDVYFLKKSHLWYFYFTTVSITWKLLWQSICLGERFILVEVFSFILGNLNRSQRKYTSDEDEFWGYGEWPLFRAVGLTGTVYIVEI